MELFRINGLSSEDLMRPGQSSAKAFLGTMFKMGAPPPGAIVEPPDEDEGVDLDSEDAKPDLEASPVDVRWTEPKLMAMTKEKLVELASSLGVADLSVTKPKLAEAILAVQ